MPVEKGFLQGVTMTWWWFQWSGGSRRPVSMSITDCRLRLPASRVLHHRLGCGPTAVMSTVLPPARWLGLQPPLSIFPVPPSLYCLGGGNKVLPQKPHSSCKWGGANVKRANGNPLQYSCLENPMDGGAWRATVHGVAMSRTRLSN